MFNIDFFKKNNNLFSSLIKFYGIGFSRAKHICRILNLEYFIKIKNLDNEKIDKLSQILCKYKISDSLKIYTKRKIEKLKQIKCYRGVRHINNLPVRGQNTKNNAKTRKKHKKAKILKNLNDNFKKKIKKK